MNICFFNDIASLGGGEIWVLNASRHLKSRGHQVSVICPYRTPLFAACQQEGLDLYSYYNVEGSPFYEPLYHFLKNRRVDVVYCTIIGGICEARILEQTLNRINEERADSRRAILILKTGLPPMLNMTPEYYGAGAGPVVRRLHVVSENNKRAFQQWQPELADQFEQYIQVVREGSDLETFDRSRHDRREARKRWQIPDDQQVVTCLARLHPMKGQDNLLLAAREVLKSHPETLFLIAGEGGERPRLEQLSEHLGLGQNVRFAGQVNDVPSLLAATDILCHPSLADGLPNAVVEAMAMGLPVVASSVGGIPEVIEDQVSGLLVPPHDIKATSNALVKLLDEAETATRLGQRAANEIKSGFSLQSNLHHLIELMEQELDEFNQTPTSLNAPPAPLVKAPLSILFLMTALRTGGEETEMGILARHLDRSAFQLSALSCWSVDEPAPVLEKLQRIGFQVDTGCYELPAIADKVNYVVNKIRREGIRVVVACQDTRLAYQVFQHLAPGECHLIEHGGITEETGVIPKTYTKRYVGVSREITNAAAALMPKKEHAVFIPSMVDPAEFEIENRSQLRAAWGFGDDCVIAFVGRLDQKKRLGDFIQAATEILPAHDNVRFLVIGGRDAFQPETAVKIFEDAKTLRDTGRFIFTGARSDVPRLLTAVDILVLPAQGEGMSHVINEAGAASLAVIAADSGSAREQLEDGLAGCIVPVGQPQLLTEAMIKLISDEGLRAKLGSRLKQKVVREYSALNLIPRWQSLFQDVTSGEPPRFTTIPLRVIKEDRRLPFPKEIQIETNTACNATCIMCPYPEVSKELPPGRMKEDLYRHILAQCAEEKTLWRIEPFLNNEPFTDKRLVSWIKLAKEMVPHAMVTVTTNGSLTTPAITDQLLTSGLDGIWFSFNGATKETYEKIMGLSYDKVKKNIDYLLSVKPPSLRVFTNMIETEPMKGEIAENIRYWQSVGVQSGSSPLVNRAGNVKNFDELNYKPVNPKPVRICELLYHKMYIGYNGDVLLCCMDWRRRIVLGNANEQSLREIWQGEKYEHYRRFHEEGRFAELDLCNTCSYVHT
jgi:radical SAM protein with 4Fe4S-binding SPASM domain